MPYGPEQPALERNLIFAAFRRTQSGEHITGEPKDSNHRHHRPKSDLLIPVTHLVIMAPFSKPETVLKQAEGLVSVGQTHAALQSLSEMFASKRFRSTPLTSLEPIMHRFIELCVEMRKGRTAKEGLMQYKNIAQNLNVQSIEAVITRFVQLADAKVREAQEKAAVKSAVDVDDLEASETPESILLGAVSGDQNKDRTDRALVTPWLKFLWESYRTSLETLKNNSRLEAIYQVRTSMALESTFFDPVVANRTTSI